MKRWFGYLLIVCLAGCTTAMVEQGQQQTRALPGEHGWRKLDLSAAPFTLTAFVPPTPADPVDRLVIYFEGDGLAWLTPDEASEDPTPLHPVALQLAFADPSAAVAYLARPCQYRSLAGEPACVAAYWTGKRYAPEVVASMNQAVSQLKQRIHARQVVLVGFSGGGALAALVAARRDDVALLITVAANVDTAAWTRIERLQPLRGSLNPADDWARLMDIPQVLLVGTRDEVVPLAVARAYVSRFPPDARPRVVVVPDFDHACCWSQGWRERVGRLLAELPYYSTRQTNSLSFPVLPSGNGVSR
ncbi:MAG: alpha/beta hydrolase [Janthinobacterium lividum]